MTLCSGALDGPQIMMLSGIGTADQLSRFNVPVIRENPEVGENVKDHDFLTMEFQRAEHISELPTFYGDLEVTRSLGPTRSA